MDRIIWRMVAKFACLLAMLPVLWLGLSGQGTGSEARSESKLAPELARWMRPQEWQKAEVNPIIRLGDPGHFDDRHIFAPSVTLEGKRYYMLYSGARGPVRGRVARLGLAISEDGVTFDKSPSPVFEYGDNEHSIVTPTILRNPDGSLLREESRLRMWYSATHFGPLERFHTLHDVLGNSFTEWLSPSVTQLERAYAPTVVKDENGYHMWFTDTSALPWVLRYAQSKDGKQWKVAEKPVMLLDQEWERDRLIYPAVVKVDGVWLMWYASYWSKYSDKTAIGFAVSSDGLVWHKNPHNPVLTPNPELYWESDYTSSQSVLRLPDGSWRMWYASRKQAPHVNRYYAIGTARWKGLD